MDIAWIPTYISGLLRPKCSNYYLTVSNSHFAHFQLVLPNAGLSREALLPMEPWNVQLVQFISTRFHSGGSCPRYWGSWDRWSPFTGSRISQWCFAAVGRHRTPGSWHASFSSSLFLRRNMLDGENVSISPLEGRTSKGIGIASSLKEGIFS